MEYVICKELVKKSSEGAVLYDKGTKSINKASLQRGDDIRANVGESVQIKCRMDYVKQRNIEAAKMKQLQPGEKSVLQSEVIVQFDFRKHCLFCSQADKYSGKKKDFELIPVRTHEFQKTVKQLCQKRNDEWGKKVNGRIQHATDLRAADALYDNKCSINFRTVREIPVRFFSDEQVTCSAKNQNKKDPWRKKEVRLSTNSLDISRKNDEEQLTIMDLTNKIAEILKDSDCEPYTEP